MKKNKSASDLIREGLQAAELGDMPHAENCYREATKISKTSVEAWGRLAYSISTQKRYAEAISLFEKTFKLHPIPGLFYQYALSLQKTGQLNKALPFFEKALSIPETQHFAWSGYCTNFCLLNPYEDWLKIREKEPPHPPLEEWAYGIGLSRELLAHVMLNNKQAFQEKLPEFEKQILKMQTLNIQGKKTAELESIYTNTKHLVIYATYLKNLSKIMQWHTPQKDQKTLYVVGDSHTLALANQEIMVNNTPTHCQSNLIIGIKAWHLADSKETAEKQGFINILKRLPSKAHILSIIGEIDCRPQEGMLPFAARHHKNLGEVIHKTAQGYITFLKQQQTQQKIIVGGVAAPKERALRDLPPPVQQDLIKTTHMFNNALRHFAKNAHFEFADIHTITKDANGLSKPNMHIDQNHTRHTTWEKALNTPQ